MPLIKKSWTERPAIDMTHDDIINLPDHIAHRTYSIVKLSKYEKILLFTIFICLILEVDGSMKFLPKASPMIHLHVLFNAFRS